MQEGARTAPVIVQPLFNNWWENSTLRPWTAGSRIDDADLSGHIGQAVRNEEEDRLIATCAPMRFCRMSIRRQWRRQLPAPCCRSPPCRRSHRAPALIALPPRRRDLADDLLRLPLANRVAASSQDARVKATASEPRPSMTTANSASGSPTSHFNAALTAQYLERIRQERGEGQHAHHADARLTALATGCPISPKAKGHR